MVHLEDGVIWIPSDALTWESAQALAPAREEPVDGEDESAGDQEDQVIEIEDDFDWMGGAVEGEDQSSSEPMATPNAPPKPRQAVPLRVRAARSDATIGGLARSIERMLDLPEGSVLLCGPDRRALRRDATVGTLRRRWE